MPHPSVDDRRLKLHPLVVAFIASYFLLVFGGLTAIAIWRDYDELTSNMFFQVAFSAGLIGVPSYGAYRIRRSSRAGNIAAVVMTCLMYTCVGTGAVVGYKATKQNQENRAALDEFDRRVQDNRDSNFFDRMAAGEDVSDEAMERLNRVAEAAENASKIDSEDGRVMGVLAAYMREIASLAEPVNDAIQAYSDAGGLDASTFESEKAVRERIALIDRCIGTTQDFADAYARIDQSLIAGLRQQGMNTREINQLVSIWRASAMPDEVVAFRTLEVEMYDAYRDILTHMHKTWGKWEPDGLGLAVFESDANLKMYDKLLEEAIDFEDRCEDLRVELAEAMRQKQQSTNP